MKRLTEVDGKGNWCIAGVEWGNVKGNLYGALCKLKDYEDTGLSPVEVAELNTFDGSQAVKATAKLQEEQRKHRWIPVLERLPKEKINPITDDYFEYNVTFCCDGKYDTRHYKFGDGHWWNSGTCMDEYVIAWQPLLVPYQPN